MNSKKKFVLALVSLVLLLGISAGGTLAYLTSTPDPIINEFQPNEVTTTVVEDFEAGVKSNVKIQNTGTTSAYIRAAVVITWQDKDGNVYGKVPVANTDYTISYKLTDGWEKAADGFYYWKKPVPADDPATEALENLTGELITECKLKEGVTAPAEGYYLTVEIIGSGIQSMPTSVVTSEWDSGVSSVNGTTLVLKK